MSVIVLDTETTGFPGQSKSSVIEVGAVCFTEDGREIGHFGSLVQPIAQLGPWATPALEVCQIEPELLEAAPMRGLVWNTLLDWMALHRPVQHVLAFNVTFDKAMMTKTFPEASHLPWGPCIMRAASAYTSGHRKGGRLMAAAEALDVELPSGSNHRAVFDAIVAGRIWQALVRRGAW